MRLIKRIIVHCTDTEDGTLQSIRHFHMSPPPNGRGFSDIGYHFLITRDGVIHTGRPMDIEGAHCVGNNADSIGVAMVGKFGRFTAKQFLSLKTVIDRLCDIHRIPKTQIFCHYELDQHGKTCPDISKDDLLKLLA